MGGNASGAAERGRALERTALAWQRSALSIAATGAFLAKAAADGGSLATGLAGAGVMVALAVAVWLLGGVAYGRSPERGTGAFPARKANAGLTAISLVAGVVALAIIVAV